MVKFLFLYFFTEFAWNHLVPSLINQPWFHQLILWWNLFQSNRTWAPSNSFLIIKFRFNIVDVFQITYMPYSWIRISVKMEPIWTEPIWSLRDKIIVLCQSQFVFRDKIKTSYTKTAWLPYPAPGTATKHPSQGRSKPPQSGKSCTTSNINSRIIVICCSGNYISVPVTM